MIGKDLSAAAALMSLCLRAPNHHHHHSHTDIHKCRSAGAAKRGCINSSSIIYHGEVNLSFLSESVSCRLQLCTQTSQICASLLLTADLQPAGCDSIIKKLPKLLQEPEKITGWSFSFASLQSPVLIRHTLEVKQSVFKG